MKPLFIRTGGALLPPPYVHYLITTRVKAAFIGTLLMVSAFTIAQSKKLTYKILQGGSEVGFLTLAKKDSAGLTMLNMESSAQKRIILLISIYEKQLSIFEKGILKYTSVYRKVNGSVKTNKSLQNNGNNYEVVSNGQKNKINVADIHHNQLSLYYEEPVNYHSVYSDQYEKLLAIEKTATGQYKIKLPDGNTNYYTYTNGMLSSIKLKHIFFSAEFILTKSE